MSEPQKVTVIKPKLVQRKNPQGFQFKSLEVAKRYPVQFAIDCGLEPGPWMIILLQKRIYAIGWIPKSKLAKRKKW